MISVRMLTKVRIFRPNGSYASGRGIGSDMEKKLFFQSVADTFPIFFFFFLGGGAEIASYIRLKKKFFLTPRFLAISENLEHRFGPPKIKIFQI